MFRKIVIADRGEIAVRIIRTCRELDIPTVALYTSADAGSQHTRMADECVLLASQAGYCDQDAILRIAHEKQADAIHPGYGFLAERVEFIRACERERLVFIGPTSKSMSRLSCKISALEKAREAGFQTVQYSPRVLCGNENSEVLHHSAEQLGYSLVVKALIGGRGQGEFIVREPNELMPAVRRAQVKAQSVFADGRVYMEKAIFPFRYVGVQILGDLHGQYIHLGEHQSLLISGNRKLIEESPAPCLTSQQRGYLTQTALELARLFHYQNAGTLEFLVDDSGEFYFSEFKSRIQLEHPLTEVLAHIDLLKEQILVAAGQPLTLQQKDIKLHGSAMLSRITAEDPWNNFLPNPGIVQWACLPGGPNVRIDTSIYAGCVIPGDYDPMIAKVTVWGEDRKTCLERMCRAMSEFKLAGVHTNIALIQQLLNTSSFIQGTYNKEFTVNSIENMPLPDNLLPDLAVAAAIIYYRRNQALSQTGPERLSSRWRRNGRSFPH